MHMCYFVAGSLLFFLCCFLLKNRIMAKNES